MNAEIIQKSNSRISQRDQRKDLCKQIMNRRHTLATPRSLETHKTEIPEYRLAKGILGPSVGVRKDG